MSDQKQPRKRAAFESPARLARPLALDPGMRRPAATVAGGVLVLLRVASGVLWLILATLDWRRLATEADAAIDGVQLTPEEIGWGLGVFWGFLGVVLVVETILAVFILRGGNRSRVTVLFLSVLSISASFSAWWVQGQDIRLGTTLLTLGLDILVLLALSSRSAAAYARRNERR